MGVASGEEENFLGVDFGSWCSGSSIADAEKVFGGEFEGAGVKFVEGRHLRIVFPLLLWVLGPRDDCFLRVIDLGDFFKRGAGGTGFGLMASCAYSKGIGSLLGPFGYGVCLHFSKSEDGIELGDMGDGFGVAGRSGFRGEFVPFVRCGEFAAVESLIDDGSRAGDCRGFGELIGECNGLIGVFFRKVPEDGVTEEWQWGRDGNLGKKFRLFVGVGSETKPNHFRNEAVVNVFGTICKGKKDGEADLLVNTMLASSGKSEAESGGRIVFGEVEEDS